MVVASDPNEKRCPVKLRLDYFQFLGSPYSGYLVPSCITKILLTINQCLIVVPF
jgi:hypothetical protein